MNVLTNVAIGLSIWWAALSLLTLRDYRRRKNASVKPPPEVSSEDEAVMPRNSLPSWCDFLRRPSLFWIVPWVLSVHAILLVLIWPLFVLHRLYFPRHWNSEKEDA